MDFQSSRWDSYKLEYDCRRYSQHPTRMCQRKDLYIYFEYRLNFENIRCW